MTTKEGKTIQHLQNLLGDEKWKVEKQQEEIEGLRAENAKLTQENKRLSDLLDRAIELLNIQNLQNKK